MIRRVATSVAIATLLSACATPTLTSQEARAYTGLNLDQFISERFSDAQSVRKAGSTYYKAYFNDINYRQILRPTQELAAYCNAQAGAFVRIRKHEGNPITQYFSSPSTDAAQVYAYARQKGFSEQIASKAAGNAYIQTERVNRTLDSDRAQNAYEASAKAGTFGTFECRESETTKNMRWSVVITPLQYLPKDPTTSLTAHTLVIEIRPI